MKLKYLFLVAAFISLIGTPPAIAHSQTLGNSFVLSDMFLIFCTIISFIDGVINA